jgi:hypothetical protein
MSITPDSIRVLLTLKIQIIMANQQTSFQVISPDHTFKSIRGRIGNFIFRTRNGKIFAFYSPRDDRPNPDPISVQFREITSSLNLQIVNQ